MKLEAQPSAELALARRECRRMTQLHAKTFYFASGLLPPAKREDAYAVYAFCRYVDDQVDHAPDAAARSAAGTGLAELLARAYAPEPIELPSRNGATKNQAWLPAFREVVQRRAIPPRYFQELLLGLALDEGAVRIATWAELDRYCYLVAGVVGLIMVHVLTEPRPELLEPARDLGTAMQLTNIIRDIAEDWQRDRIYVPAEELARFGVDPAAIAAGKADAQFRELLRFQIARARDYYQRAEPGLRALPVDGSRRTARLMSTLYGAILREVERNRYDVFARRARVTFPRKVWLAAQVWHR